MTVLARITHPAAATIVAISVRATRPARGCRRWEFGFRGLVSDARGRDHGSMRAIMTISSSERACSCHRWLVPDSHDIAAHALASCFITGRGWVLNGSQEM